MLPLGVALLTEIPREAVGPRGRRAAGRLRAPQTPRALMRQRGEPVGAPAASAADEPLRCFQSR
eukprot:5739274-Pyramimonas_sp.AAC.1